jgi:hypothetical protein
LLHRTIDASCAAKSGRTWPVPRMTWWETRCPSDWKSGHRSVPAPSPVKRSASSAAIFRNASWWRCSLPVSSACSLNRRRSRHSSPLEMTSASGMNRDSARFLRNGSAAFASESRTASIVSGARTSSVLPKGNHIQRWSQRYLSLRSRKKCMVDRPAPCLHLHERKARFGATSPWKNPGTLTNH